MDCLPSKGDILGVGNVGIVVVDDGVSEGVNVGGEGFTLVVCSAGCKVVMFSSGSPDELLPRSVEVTLPILETSILEPDKKILVKFFDIMCIDFNLQSCNVLV